MSLDVFDQAQAWRQSHRDVALATVTDTGGSSPRPIGSLMAIAANGEFVGSVSGGCIEGAVMEEAREVLETGVPKRLTYGIADEEAWAVGLSCGGDIGVFVERLPNDAAPDDWFAQLHQALRDERSIHSLTVLAADRTDLASTVGAHSVHGAEHDAGHPASRPSSTAVDAVLGDWWLREPGVHRIGDYEVFVQNLEAPPKLVIVGAVHIAEHLVHFAKRLDFHTVVVDAREAFATEARFAHADELVVGWPSEVLKRLPVRSTTYCTFLTHDPKFDDDALKVALEAKARYVGALGSTRTHAKRCQRLTEVGVSTGDLDRIDAPIGLDLGGRRPEEIALSIAARLVQVRASSASPDSAR